MPIMQQQQQQQQQNNANIPANPPVAHVPAPVHGARRAANWPAQRNPGRVNNVVQPVAAPVPGTTFDPDVPGALNLRMAKPVMYIHARVNNKQKKHIVEAIPELQFVFTNTDSHPHPVAALERYWAEYRAALALFGLLQWPLPGQPVRRANKLLAFNSSAARFAGHNMLDVVEFFKDTQVSADVFRNIEAVPGATIHEDLNLTMDLGNMFGAILWTHCVHRFTREEVAVQLLCTDKRVGMALTHTFDGYQGSVCADEATWTRVGPAMDEVEMLVAGGTPYRHSACDWLYDNGCHVEVGDVTYTLCWTTSAVVGDTRLLQFRLHEGELPFVTPVTSKSTLAGALRTSYGEIDLRSYHKSGPARNKGTEVLFVPTNKVYAFGPFDHPRNRTVIIVPDGVTPLAVPNGLVSELAGYVSGKKRTADSWQSINGRAKQLLRETTLSTTQAAAALPYVCALGFLQHLTDETTALMMVGDNEAQIAMHSQLTDFNFELPWHVRLFQKWPMLGRVVRWLVAKWPRKLSTIAVALLYALWRFRWVRTILFGRRANWLEAIRTFKRLVIKIYHQFTVFFNGRYRPIKVGDDAMTAVCVGDRELKPMHKDARVYFDESARNQCKPSFGNMPIGVFVTQPRPTVYANCIDNEIAAVVNRGCINRTDDEETESFWQMATEWERKFPTLSSDRVEPIPTEVWLKRFPGPRQEEHRRALAQETLAEVNTASEAFDKRENALNFDAEGIVLTDPRLIQGKSSMMQITLGPFFVSYSKFTARHWNGEVSPNVPQTFFYASGTDANAIGRWFDRSLKVAKRIAKQHGLFVVLIDLDQSRFDATVGIPALHYNLFMYERNGMPTRSAALYRRAMSCRGVTAHGVRYSVVGTRKSGEADTSVGNSALNKCVASIYAALYTKWTSMALLGDDNNTISVSSYPPQVAAAALRDVCQDAGFQPEAHVVTNPFDMTFCSSRFWPSNTGSILGPKIGRVVAKTFYAIRMVDHADAMAQVRGICLGMVNDVQHIPVLRAMIPRMIQLTSGHRVTPVRQAEQRFHAREAGVCVDKTWEMMLHLYELTRDDILDLEQYMREIPSLPCGLNHWVLDRIISIDCPMKGKEIAAPSEITAVPHRVVDETEYDRLDSIDPVGDYGRSMWPRASLIPGIVDFIAKSGIGRHALTFSIHDVLLAPLYEEWAKRKIPHVWWLLPLIELLGDLPNLGTRIIMLGFHTWCTRQNYALGVFAHAVNNYCAGVVASALISCMNGVPNAHVALIGAIVASHLIRVAVTGRFAYVKDIVHFVRNFARKWVTVA